MVSGKHDVSCETEAEKRGGLKYRTLWYIFYVIDLKGNLRFRTHIKLVPKRYHELNRLPWHKKRPAQQLLTTARTALHSSFLLHPHVRQLQHQRCHGVQRRVHRLNDSIKPNEELPNFVDIARNIQNRASCHVGSELKEARLIRESSERAWGSTRSFGSLLFGTSSGRGGGPGASALGALFHEGIPQAGPCCRPKALSTLLGLGRSKMKRRNKWISDNWKIMRLSGLEMKYPGVWFEIVIRAQEQFQG